MKKNKTPCSSDYLLLINKITTEAAKTIINPPNPIPNNWVEDSEKVRGLFEFVFVDELVEVPEEVLVEVPVDVFVELFESHPAKRAQSHQAAYAFKFPFKGWLCAAEH